MPVPLNADLNELLTEPREALDIELKEWLDLADNGHRAALAKEIIALANYGGGFLVIGFKENDDGTFAVHAARPANLNAWSQDAIQGIVAKYVDPEVQCRVVHQLAPGSTERYPIIIVPGGHRIPIRAKAGSPDNSRLVAHRVYVRRAGPNSEEPRTAEEWVRLLEQCVQNRQSELLDAMRSIIAGVVPAGRPKEPTRLDQLAEFERAAVERWQARIAKLPPDAPPRFVHGHYDVGIAIDGGFDIQNLSDLRNTIKTAVRNHSGWPPFLTINRHPFAPKPVDGAVEFWLGPDTDGSFDQPAHHDFWRISSKGLLFTRRGLQEDGGVHSDISPGTTLDITTPTWRIGEAIMQANYIARALNAQDANLICHCRWAGLRGRRLVSRGNPNRHFLNAKQIEQDTYKSMETIGLPALPQALPEIVFAILKPLYELFEFFPLPKRLVEEELATLMRTAF